MNTYLVYHPDENFEFQARWIAPAGSEKEANYTFRALKIFELSRLPEHPAQLRISADSVYRVWLNGVEIGAGPIRGTMSLQYYDCYHVHSLLRLGRNVLAVMVHCVNEDNFTVDTAQPGLIAELSGCTRTDGTWLVAPAPDWRRDVEYYAAQIGRAEWRDFRHEPSGWLAGEGVSRWMAAKAVAAESRLLTKKLVARDIPALRESIHPAATIPVIKLVADAGDPNDIHIARQSTQEASFEAPPRLAAGAVRLLRSDEAQTWEIPVPGEGRGVTFVADFQCEVSGALELEVTGMAGTIVDIAYEEELSGDRLRAEHGDGQGIYHFADRYILDGKRRTLGTTLTERGFRMVQVTFRQLRHPVKVHAIRAVDRRYPVAFRGSFFCDDMMLNRIWEISCRTLSSCMQDVFVDCPWRERAYWVNDLIVENRTSLQAFGASAIHPRAFRLAFSQSAPSGLLPAVCPAPIHHHPNSPWPNLSFDIPATNLYIARMLHDYWMYSGDRETVYRHLSTLEGTLELFHGWTDADGLLDLPPGLWNFVDWSFELTGIDLTGKRTAILQAFYRMALKDFLELARAVGFHTKQEVFRERYERSGEAFRRFFDPATGRLADWVETDGSLSAHSSQLAYALAILTDAVPEAYWPQAAAGLEDPQALMPEFYMHCFVLQAMPRCDRTEAAVQRVRQLWGRCALAGADVWWECGVQEFGKKAFRGDGSLCHGFASSPVDVLQSVVAGISPLEAGFRRFRCHPQLGELRFLRCEVPTPTGSIGLEVERLTEGLRLILRVPPESEACLDDGRVFPSGCHCVVLR